MTLFLSVRPGVQQASALVLVFGLELVLLAIPVLAIAMLSIRAGLRSQTAIWIAGLGGLSLAGYLAFWLFLAGPVPGWIYSIAVLLVATGLCPFTWSRLTDPERAVLLGLWRPGVLVASFSLYVCSLGYMYGGLGQPLALAANRFSHQLPFDNTLPLLFAQQLLSNHRPIPSTLVLDWLSSDRPPLQTGLYLLVSPLGRWDQELQYQVLAVILQSLFVIGIWAYVRESHLPGSVRAFALAVPILSGWALVNDFFVWPKLLAAAFLLLVMAVLFTPRYHLVRSSARWGAGVGLLAGLAMLSHDSSAIAILGIGVTLLLIRRIPSPIFIAAVVGAFLVVELPWFLYQHVIDPPGDRLIKWYVGGQIPLTSKGLLATIVDAYRQVGLGGALSNRLQNLAAIWGTPIQDLRDAFKILQSVITAPTNLSQARLVAGQLRVDFFFQLIPQLGLMVLGPFSLAAGWLRSKRASVPPGDAWHGAFTAWVFVACTTLIWVAVFFGPATTVPHQGSYALELVALFGSAIALTAVAGRLGAVLCAVQIAGSLVLYDVLTPAPTPAWVALQSGFTVATALLALVSLAVVIGLLITDHRSPDLAEA